MSNFDPNFKDAGSTNPSPNTCLVYMGLGWQWRRQEVRVDFLRGGEYRGGGII